MRAPLLIHEAALPFLCAERGAGRLAVRVGVMPERGREVRAITLLYGDPFEWENAGAGSRWQYKEAPLTPEYAWGGSLPQTATETAAAQTAAAETAQTAAQTAGNAVAQTAGNAAAQTAETAAAQTAETAAQTAAVETAAAETAAAQTAAERAAYWHTEIPVPPRRRMKYCFRVTDVAAAVWHFGENGAEAWGEEVLGRQGGCFFYPYIHECDAPAVPSWAKDTVWYQIFPDRFRRAVNAAAAGTPGTPGLPAAAAGWEAAPVTHKSVLGGNIAGIREKLPYLSELGVNGLYLTPVFASPSNHKYNTEDYFTIDPAFGTMAEMKALVREARGRGIRVMFDAVFNHSGSTHPFWQDVLENGARSAYRDYFHINRFPVEKGTVDRARPSYETFAFVSQMPKWNTEHPAVRKYLLDAAVFWMEECGIDGWRLDVANEVSFSFLREFAARTRECAQKLNKEFYIVGEVWHDASPWINAGVFDAAMNYPLQYAVSDFFLKKTLNARQFTARLYRALGRYSRLHNGVMFNLLDSHDTDRALTRAKKASAKAAAAAKAAEQSLKNAFTMLFLLPGSPCVYYGTEAGMEGEGDPDCRRPMLWLPEPRDGELFDFFRRLIAFRKKNGRFFARAGICYKRDTDYDIWEFSDGNTTISAVFDGVILEVKE